MTVSIIAGFIIFISGAVYLVLTLMMPNASVGKYPFEPKIFPMVLSILLLVMSFCSIVRDFVNIQKKKALEGKAEQLQMDKYMKKILLIGGVAIVYALLFGRIGYVLSTILFLECVLFIFNGFREWKINTIVAVLFSISVYLIFAKLLNVYLPMTPFLNI